MPFSENDSQVKSRQFVSSTAQSSPKRGVKKFIYDHNHHSNNHQVPTEFSRFNSDTTATGDKLVGGLNAPPKMDGAGINGANDQRREGGG